MSYDKRKLSDLLRKVVASASTELASSTRRRSIVVPGAGTEIAFNAEDGNGFRGVVPDDHPPSVEIFDEGCDALDDLVTEVRRDQQLQHLVDRKTIYSCIEKIVVDIVTREDQAAPDYDKAIKADLLKSLRGGISEWTVLVPLVNLGLSQPIRICGIDLLPRNHGYVENVRFVMDRIGTGDAQRLMQEQAAMLKVLGDACTDSTTWGRVTIRAHASRLSFVAISKVESVINLVRAFSHVFYPHSIACAFGLAYDRAGGAVVTFGRTRAGSLSFQWDHRSSAALFELSENRVAQLREKYAFDTLESITSKDSADRSNLEAAIYAATHWLGRSVAMVAREDAFTFCAIAIERLLICDGEEATTEKFAERLAYILSDDPDTRKQVYRDAKRLYHVRSRIVHAGYVGVETEEYVDLENLALCCLVEVAKRIDDFKDQDGLKGWLHNQKMR